MNGLKCPRLFLCVIALILLFAPFAFEVMAAQDSGSATPAKQVKTRFSDSGTTAKNGGSKKAPPAKSCCSLCMRAGGHSRL